VYKLMFCTFITNNSCDNDMDKYVHEPQLWEFDIGPYQDNERVIRLWCAIHSVLFSGL